MKILWACSVFLHPTTRGGQIRTLETLKQLHKRHEVHYVALADPADQEGPARAVEYSSKVYPIPYRIAPKTSAKFYGQLVEGVFSSVPVVVFRKKSDAVRAKVAELMEREKFDSVVCDFLTPSINMPQLDKCVLFQHNVETMIWRRLAETSTGFKRAYMQRQAERMFEYEKRVCQTVRHTIAVSEIDAQLMREMFGVTNVEAVPTGVDIEYFAKPASATRETDMVFVGSMDYLPNVDGILWFTQEVLPLIRQKRPDCTLTVVGRKPPREIQAIAEADPRVKITGTVPDVRPYLWGGAMSIVPLRVGGGTRLKIYESMAAGTPIVSTTIGAEGLEINPPRDIRIGDTAEEFAAQTLALLDSQTQRDAVARAAWELVNAKFSWEKISRDFEHILERTSVNATV